MIASRWRPLLLAISTVLLGTIAAGSPASAGSFKVNPVNLTIPADRSTTSLSLANSGSEPVSVRVLTYRWTQVDGDDMYTESTDVIVSPPIFTLDPGQAQLVRVGLWDRRSGEAYRVIFEEIPREEVSGTVVQVALRLDLPLHVETASGKPNVTWQAWRDGAGEITLEATNSGARHEKVLSIGLDGESESPVLTREMGAVLPSSARRWVIGKQPDLTAGSAVTLNIRTPAGEAKRKVVVQQR